MLLNHFNPAQKRIALREALKSGRLLQFPGAISPLTAMEITRQGFDGIYVSGSVLSNDLGYPDIGLTTLSEIAQRGRQIARVTPLPSIIDADTGFGEPLNTARTIQELIESGIAGCHLEDQVQPKRCGHLDGKSLVSVSEMVKKIKAADLARKIDPHFVIIARTDARATEGLEGAIERAKAYVDAGADVIFPEALGNEREFEAFRKALSVPLLANMTEFGKSPLLSYRELQQLGYNIVIYPVTLLRLSMGVIRRGLMEIKSKGHQRDLVSQMQTRQELYELTSYETYNQWDQSIFNFTVTTTKKEE
ncbi:MAG: methylisocitrate lyase [Bdellovibrionaceae bacterium]|nr:methylisocitrate lyase [Pseudobdellovibrionaceae bacterium]MDW8191081.1 methylisocitrate lyase [Pseudobdellovibrionaceae bacterium]